MTIYQPAQVKLPFSPKFHYARNVSLGQSPVVAAASAMLIPTSIAAATAYVGFRLGSKDHGIPSILGYAVGVVGGLATIGFLLATVGIVSLGPILRPAQPAPEAI